MKEKNKFSIIMTSAAVFGISISLAGCKKTTVTTGVQTTTGGNNTTSATTTEKDATTTTKTEVTTQKEVMGDEAGVYYLNSKEDDISLALTIGNRFSLQIGNDYYGGKYEIAADGSIVLTFEDDTVANAFLAEGVLQLNYNQIDYTLLRKVSYEVTFDTLGGSEVSAVKVLNGLKVEAPADPTKEGYALVGWYKDENLTEKFDFNAPITGNTTIYAYWAEKVVGASEYKVTLVDSEGNVIDTIDTIGSKAYGLPTLTKEGETFAGWYISSYEDQEKATRKYTEGEALTGNATLFAVFKADALDVSADVLDSSIVWDMIEQATYNVKIENAGGMVLVDEAVASNILDFDWSNVAQGDYKITVTTTKDGETYDSVRYYQNKALAKVTNFKVVNNTLLFDAVKGATRYYIDVECGNKSHNHVALDLGTSTYFDFSNCAMGEEGITFTVKATANGYTASVSDPFNVSNKLEKVEGFAYDSATGVITWNKVENATKYLVKVNGSEYVDNGASNTYDLRGVSGTVEFEVLPVADMYYSIGSSKYEVVKNELKTPENISIVGYTLTWDAVEGAESYSVNFNGRNYIATTNEFDFTQLTGLQIETLYTVSVRANGATNSLWSDTKDVYYKTMNNSLNYLKGEVSWDYVIGAGYYEVKVNNGKAVRVQDGAGSTKVTLTKEGFNTIYVRFYENENKTYSDWAEIDVYAYEVRFSSVGGSEVKNGYYSVGDPINFPTPTKEGYTLNGWYNVPGGAKGNGIEYTSQVFESNSSMSLYANWLGLPYEISYYSAEGEEEKVTVNYGDTFKLKTIPSDSAANIFDGWYLDEAHQVRLTDANGNSVRGWSYSENQVVYPAFRNVLKFTEITDAVTGKKSYQVDAGFEVNYAKEITIPETYEGLPVTRINEYAFRSAVALETINIPNSIEYISATTSFYDCVNLKAINIYEAQSAKEVKYESVDGVLVTIGNEGEKALSLVPQAKTGDFRVPNYITSIPTRAFYGTSLKSVYIPSSVTLINSYAFCNASKLTSVEFEMGGTEELEIASYVFRNCPILREVTFPSRVKEMNFRTVFYGSFGLEAINFEEGAQYNSSVDGVVFSADGETLVYYPLGKVGNYKVPAGCYAIGDYAFGYRIDEYNSEAAQGITGIEIPYYVTTIGTGAFYDCKTIKSVTFTGSSLGADPVEIKDMAFYGCKGATSLTIGENTNIEKIGRQAFYATSFADVVIPGTVKEIGSEAFYACSADRITIKANENPLVFPNRTFGLVGTTARLCDFVIEEGANIVEIGTNCFIASNIKEIYLPNSLTKIDANAFINCGNLKKVTLDVNNATFGSNVFKGCKSLTEIVITSNTKEGFAFGTVFDGTPVSTVSSIGENAAYTVLENVIYNKDITAFIFFPYGYNGPYTLPETITTIANGAFKATKITAVTIPGTVTSIGSSAFAECGLLTAVNFLEGTEALTIGNNAFDGCAKLVEINIPKRVTTIGNSVFSNCPSLKAVNIEEGNTNFVSEAGILYNAAKTTMVFVPKSITGAITIPATITAIPNSAFSGSLITEVTIPASVATIGTNAFNACTALTKVTFADGIALTKIDSSAFAGCSELKEITIPNSVTTLGTNVFKGSAIETVNLSVIDSNLTTIPTSAFEGCMGLTAFAVPEKVTQIASKAFYNCGNLSTITFAEGSKLTTIGANAFELASDAAKAAGGLTSVSLPKTVSSFGASAFKNHSKLSSFDFNGNTVLKALGGNAFENCVSLSEITLPTSLTSIGASAFAMPVTDLTKEQGLRSIVIPAGITASGLNTKVFCANTRLTSVSFLGTSITTIGANTFQYCNHLTDITLPTSITTINGQAFDGCTALTSINSAETKVKTLGTKAFQNSGITEFAFPTSVTTLGTVSNTTLPFNGCQNLTKLVLPTSVANGYIIMGAPALEEIDFYGSTAAKLKVVDGVLVDVATEKIVYGALTGYSADVVLPAGVTSIYQYAFRYSAAKSVRLTKNASGVNTLAEIGNYAFADCANLESFDFPTSLTKIGTYAFQNATSLRSANLYEGLTSLGNYAFSGASSIKEAVIPSTCTSVGTNVFQNCTNLEKVEFKANVAAIGNLVFSGSGIKSIIIPASVKSTGSSTFQNCKNLETVTFAEGSIFTTFGTQTFMGCSSLTNIEIPASATSLGTSVFNGCTSLKSINIPSSVTQIGMTCFQGASALEEVIFEDESACTQILDRAFSGCSSLASITIPEKVTKIGVSAFEKTALVEITIPSSVTSLGNTAFQNAASLETVVFESGLKTIGTNMFGGCSSLVNVTLPDTLTAIPTNTFNGCSSLKTIAIPESVKSIADYAFKDCASLESFTIADQITTIGGGVFSGCTSLTEETLKISEGNAKFVLANGFLMDAANTTVYGFISSEEVEELVIPEGIQKIGASAFANSSYKKITLPESLTSIGKQAFAGLTEVTEITIPANCTSLGESAFDGCLKLAKVEFLGQTLNCSYNMYIFRNCKALTDVKLPQTVKGAYMMFEGCTSIKELVVTTDFEDCAEMFTGWKSDQKILIIGNPIDLYRTTVGPYDEDYEQYESGVNYAWFGYTEAKVYFYSEFEPASNKVAGADMNAYDEMNNNLDMYEEGQYVDFNNVSYWHYDSEGNVEIWGE